MKIKKGDNIIVLAGKDKGKKSKVLRVFPKLNLVLAEDVNVVKKHSKANKRGKKGEVIEKTLPIHISNVSILDPKTNKPSRVGYKIDGGKKIRIARKSGEKI